MFKVWTVKRVYPSTQFCKSHPLRPLGAQLTSLRCGFHSLTTDLAASLLPTTSNTCVASTLALFCGLRCRPLSALKFCFGNGLVETSPSFADHGL